MREPSPEEARRISEHLQKLVEKERKTAIEIQLGDLGPYLFPRCRTVLSARHLDAKTFELELETERDQRVRIPIQADSLIALKLLVDHLARDLQPKNPE